MIRNPCRWWCLRKPIYNAKKRSKPTTGKGVFLRIIVTMKLHCSVINDFRTPKILIKIKTPKIKLKKGRIKNNGYSVGVISSR